MLKKFPLFCVLSVFTMKELDFVKCFLCGSWDEQDLPSPNPLFYKYDILVFLNCETLFYFQEKFQLFSCIIFLIFFWIWFTSILLRIFASLFTMVIGLLFFLCCLCLWYQDNTGLIKGTKKSFFHFFAQVQKIGIYSLFKCLVEFTSDAFWFWTFLSWGISTSFLKDSFVRFIIINNSFF